MNKHTQIKDETKQTVEKIIKIYERDILEQWFRITSSITEIPFSSIQAKLQGENYYDRWVWNNDKTVKSALEIFNLAGIRSKIDFESEIRRLENNSNIFIT